MSIACVVSFSGFPDAAECHLALPDGGYPAAVASGFIAARREAGRPAAFLKAFSATHHGARLLAPEPDCSDPCREGAAYHYRVRLVGRRKTPLLVDCWRRYPGGLGWQRRCGPMALERFVERFLPPQGLGSEWLS